MVTPQRRADAQSRLRKAHATLGAARALLHLGLRDDAVNRASTAALQACRALVESQWAQDSSPGWDPSWRPGMPNPGQPKDPASQAAVQKLINRFASLAGQVGLKADIADYLRALVEDGFDADFGESPAYDEEEAADAIEMGQQVTLAVADQLGLGEELRKQHPARPAAHEAAPVVPSPLP